MLNPEPQPTGASQNTPYHFCTYFDQNYLTRGLALYRSLQASCRQPFVLWVLCFDEPAYRALIPLAGADLRPIRAADFEAGDAGLAAARSNRSRVEYYWTCTPSLPLYVLRQTPEIQIITYLDADLLFYTDPLPLYQELAEGSIGIIEHRYAPQYQAWNSSSGIYNVGLLIFRHDADGLACLHWWRERCLEWCYAYHEEGKYGDQKYLDDWPERFRRVVVLQHLGVGLAPWNLSRYRLEYSDAPTVDGVPLICYHFHSYKPVGRHFAKPADHQYRLDATAIAWLYLPYSRALARAAAEVRRQDRTTRSADTVSWPAAARGLLVQRLLWLGPLPLALLVWRLGGGGRALAALLHRLRAARQTDPA